MSTATATNKFQIGAAALAVAAAATLTPVAAQAAPSFAPFSLAGLGGSATDTVSSPVIPGHGRAPAAAAAASSSPSASATTNPCTTANFKLGCYLVAGATQGTYAIVRGVVIYVGTVAYVAVEATGQVLKLMGSFLPGAIGTFFTNVGNGVSTIANNIAETLHVGPYLPSS